MEAVGHKSRWLIQFIDILGIRNYQLDHIAFGPASSGLSSQTWDFKNAVQRLHWEVWLVEEQEKCSVVQEE